jgi:pimeloyl-ACP methyl ester carboxylesterase
MAHSTAEYTESTINIGSTGVTLLRAGSGRRLLVLHEELGHPGWLAWQRNLSQDHSLLVPVHPGFGQLPRADWISSARDLASFYSRMLREMALGPVDVIGFSLGGWIAAEMAAADAGQFRSMTLVGATGVRPPEGEIMDLFVMTARAYLDASVHDASSSSEFSSLYGEETPEQFEAWEDARAESARLAWKPYMHNPSLPHLLEGVQGLPTLIVWGRDDRIVPLSAGQAYSRAITGSELVVFDNCGHRPEIEQTQQFIGLLREFLVQE